MNYTYTYVIYRFVIIFFLCACANANSSQKNEPLKAENTIQVEILAQNLDVPWGLDVLPDSKLIFTERSGAIFVLDVTSGELKKIAERNIRNRAEGGLLGLAVDPEFATTNYIFIYETIETGNRIVRLKYFNDTLSDETILIDKIPHAWFHDGGILRFGPDGFLYAGTGDAREPALAQDLKSYAGKILRMDKEGKAPADNPFGNLIYSFGHRNVQGLCWDENGTLYASEHGPSGEINGWCCHDELNKIIKGGNYGWPYVIGDETKQGTILPVAHSGNDTWAPGGIAIRSGKLYMACLRGERLIQFDIEKNYAQQNLYHEKYGRLRNILPLNANSFVFCSSNKDGRGNADKTDDKLYKLTIN